MTQKTAIITGAGQGIGRAIALEFAANKIHSILVGRTEEKLQAVAKEIEASQGTATLKTVELSKAKEIQALASSLADETIDILINCAGDWLIKPMDNTTEDELEHIFDINLKAPYRLSRALLAQLRKSENASIINIGSMAAIDSFPEITAYTAAKTGLRGLTGSLAAELKPELIRVVMVSPSPADTPMRWAASPDADPKTLLQPETIAKLVSFIVNLPKGITLDDVAIKSMLINMRE
jgi:short-subunit dehydrogenase